jgi:hypothetical protein
VTDYLLAAYDKHHTVSLITKKFYFRLIVNMYLRIPLKLGGTRGGAVVEALHYKPEGRGIDSRWCHWNFTLT